LKIDGIEERMGRKRKWLGEKRVGREKGWERRGLGEMRVGREEGWER
jgi:hypothetical protein